MAQREYLITGRPIGLCDPLNLESSFKDTEGTSQRALSLKSQRRKGRKPGSQPVESKKYSPPLSPYNQVLVLLKRASEALAIITTALIQTGLARQSLSLDWSERGEGTGKPGQEQEWEFSEKMGKRILRRGNRTDKGQEVGTA